MSSVSNDDLINSYQFIGVTPSEDVLNLSMDLCIKFNVSAEDFVDYWSSFTVSNKYDINPTIDLLRTMERKYMKRMISKDNVNYKEKHSFINEDGLNDENIGNSCSHANATPERKKAPSLAGSAKKSLDSPRQNSQTPSTYEKRTNSMSTALHYKREIDIDNFQSGKVLSINNIINNNWQQFRFMYEVPLRQLISIHNSTNKFCEIMKEKFKNNKENTQYYSGRISNTNEGKLNLSSLYLQTMNGPKFKLQFNDKIQCSLFPGQSVCINGNFLNKNLFMVEEIVDDATPEEHLMVNDNINAKENLDIVLAAGPFTLKNNLTYEPLLELLKYVVDKRPNVLILMGPFLDESNDCIKNDDINNADYDTDEFDLQYERIIDTIVDLVKDVINIQIVIISSFKDVNNYPIYPTPAYNITTKYPNVKFMPDPCLLNINGIIIGLNNVDVLFHLGKYECGINTFGRRMINLTSHLIKQRCFYPLYPADDDVNVDIELLYKNGMMNVKPDILILPSNFHFFAEKVKDTLVVNPQRLVKMESGGTFAHMQIENCDRNEILKRTDCRIINI